MKILRVLALSLLLLIPVLIPAAVPGPGSFAALDLGQKKTYDLAFLQFDGIALSPANTYLTFSIPLLIKEGIAAIPAHTLDAAEIDALKKTVIQQTISGERQKLNTARKNRDELLFGNKTVPAQAVELAKLDKEIAASLAYIRFLKTEQGITVNLPVELPITIKSGNNALYERFGYSLFQFAQKNKFDLVIEGSIEEIHDYLSIEIRAFSTILEKEVFVYRNAGESGKIYDYIQEGITGLVNLVVGRPWASLKVHTDYPDASILLNNIMKGYGNMEAEYLVPETVHLSVRYPGFKAEERDLVLIPYAVQQVDIALAAETSEKVWIITDPAESDLYLNTVWKGKTPIELDYKAGLMEILLVKEGYNNYQISLERGIGNPFSVALIPDGIDPLTVQKEKRDKFYTSFGIFLLCIPIAVLCQGFAYDFGNAALDPQLLNREQDNLRITSQVFQYLQWGGVALDVVLFIDVLGKLLDYLAASDKLTG